MNISDVKESSSNNDRKGMIELNEANSAMPEAIIRTIERTSWKKRSGERKVQIV